MSGRESTVQAFEAVLAGVGGQSHTSGAGIKYPSSTETPADIRHLQIVSNIADINFQEQALWIQFI